MFMLTVIYQHEILIIGQVTTSILFQNHIFASESRFTVIQLVWITMTLTENVPIYKNKQAEKRRKPVLSVSVFCLSPFFLPQLLLPSDRLITHRLNPPGISTTLALNHYVPDGDYTVPRFSVFLKLWVFRISVFFACAPFCSASCLPALLSSSMPAPVNLACLPACKPGLLLHHTLLR